MFSNERDQLRQVFFTAWQKHLTKTLIEPLEAEIIEVIMFHPEYHTFLENPDKYQLHDFGDSNPFLHLSLHLALREQIKTNRPAGIHAVYQALLNKIGDKMNTEHTMMDCLEQILWEAQKTQTFPNEDNYLATLQALLTR